MIDSRLAAGILGLTGVMITGDWNIPGRQSLAEMKEHGVDIFIADVDGYCLPPLSE